jgi:outer membrane protein assembly factor BamB
MISIRHLPLVSALTAVILCSCGGAIAGSAPSDWENWRGPNQTGVSPDGNPPIEWSEEKNVRFKVPLPGRALSSPIVSQGRVFVLSSAPLDEQAYDASQEAAQEVLDRGEWPPKVAPVKQRFLVQAFSAEDGRLLWEQVATERVPHESHYIDSAWSCASPVTDGKRLIAHFGSNGTYAYDLDGKPLWQVDLGDMETRRGFGEGSSPAIHGRHVVINWDHEGDSFITALDIKSGKTLWKVSRPAEVTSWATPLIVKVGGKAQIIITGTGNSRGYDLKSGKEIWSLGGMTVNAIPTPITANGVAYITSGYRDAMLQAIDLKRATGALEESPALLWSHEKDTPYVASPLLYGDRLFIVKSLRNILSSFEIPSGKLSKGPTRLTELGDIWASPVGAADRIYLFDRDGTTLVMKRNEEWETLALNRLDGVIDATPAIVGDTMYVRSRTHLYALSNRQEPLEKD